MNRAARRGGQGRKGEDPVARARRLLAGGQADEALSLLERWVRGHPRDGTALQLAGLAALQLGRPGRAVERLRAARAHDPQDPALATNLAIALGEAGENEEALAILREIAAHDPPFAPALYNLGVLLRRLDRQGEARAALEQALAAAPEYHKARAALAAVLLDLGESAAALRAAEAVLAFLPDDAETRFNAGLGARRLGRFEAAAGHFAGLEGSPVAALQRGACLQELGRHEEALAAYRAALAADRDLYASVVKELTRAARGRLPLSRAGLRERLLG